ncbi:hypothetical protein CsSME_00009115 [Camellia sinensis var. sinensis]
MTALSWTITMDSDTIAMNLNHLSTAPLDLSIISEPQKNNPEKHQRNNEKPEKHYRPTCHITRRTRRQRTDHRRHNPDQQSTHRIAKAALQPSRNTNWPKSYQDPQKRLPEYQPRDHNC